MTILPGTAVLLSLASLAAPAAGPERRSVEAPPVDFQRDIRPILSDNCFQCHGPDEAERAAGLRLDLEDTAKAPFPGGGAAIVPGSLEDSELPWRIRSDVDGERMPPRDSGKSLEPHEIELLERWIEEGAQWSEHWAFVQPDRPEAPNSELARNELDAFVHQRLAAEELAPEPCADPASLLRRLTLDLTGLPPTPLELDAFLADPSDGAWQAAITRLLASPRHGEHMARPWLDAARYADTHGLHLDNERTHWLWREWVIDAFQQNKPFDEFTIEQLAGDLLPDATREQRIASGFNRNNPTSAEGGMIAAEYLALYAKDRVDTTSTVWLGLTMGCAQCHDHKFDPFSQREYYELYAFFNSLSEEASDRNIRNPVPFMAVPLAEQEQRQDELDLLIAELTRRTEEPMPQVDIAQAQFEAAWRDGAGPAWEPLVPSSLESTGGSTLTADGPTVAVSGQNPAKDTYVIEAATDLDQLTALRLDAITPAGAKIPGRAVNENFVLSGVKLEAWPGGCPEAARELELDSGWASFSQAQYGIETVLTGGNGWAGLGREGNRSGMFVLAEPFTTASSTSPRIELRVTLEFQSIHQQHALASFALHASGDQALAPLRAGSWSMSQVFPPPAGGARAAHGEVYPPEPGGPEGEVVWTERADIVDGQINLFEGTAPGAYFLRRTIFVPERRGVTLGLGSDDALKVWIDGELVHANPAARGVALDQDRVSIELEAGSHEVLAKVTNYGGAVGIAWRVLEEEASGAPHDIGLALSSPHPDDAERLRRWYRSNRAPQWIALVEERETLEAERTQLVASYPTVLVSQELEMRRTANILERGAYDRPGEEVQPATPAALHPFPEGAPADRLGLARWIVSRENPLTARVFVNRLWQHFFGTGLVKTAEDFGNQGEWPSHPELLDWLAVEFMESGWDVQHIVRLIVDSATYRQSSSAAPEKYSRDPENRLLARGPSHRLDAEVIRDQALLLAGLLREEVGGPSVRPYQPSGLWRAVGYTSSNTAVFRQDAGEANWRRSLYTFWKRTSPPPNLQTFDAPSREACVVRRARTNTPLQALVLMNDPQFVEAARAFGARILQEGGEDTASRVRWAFRSATGRWPDDDEAGVLESWLEGELEAWSVEEASELHAVGSATHEEVAAPEAQAAYTMLASLLLNLDEVVTQR